MKSIILLSILFGFFITVTLSSVEIKKAFGNHPEAGHYYINVWLGESLLISQKAG